MMILCFCSVVGNNVVCITFIVKDVVVGNIILMYFHSFND